VYCNAETVPRTEASAFDGSYIEYSTLHVPASAIDAYRTTEPWSKFGTIVAIDGDEPVVPEPDQCEKPTIYYANGKLSFKSATEGVQFVSEITDADVKKNYTAEVDLSITYTISVYATKEGYRDSEVATATLCWIEVEPQKEGITDDEVSVSEVKAVPVLIQADGRQIVITGAADGTPISVFSINGMQAGSAISQNGKTTIPVQLSGNIAIVKIGDRSVKVRRD